MSLLDEIRSDLVTESADLSNTLRKAKILASAIGLPEFREWIDFELSGYPDPEKVPSYRRFHPTNFGTFVGPFNSMAKNMVLPTHSLSDEIRDFVENVIFVDGVGALEALASNPDDPHVKKWPQEVVILTRDSIQMSGNMVLVDAHQRISDGAIIGVLDQVKNKLLDFVLGLQESNITSEDLDNRTVEPEVARGLFQIINIYGDRNIVASGEHVNQRVNTVQKGDIDSLLRVLRELNINDDDLSELKNAVSSEPNVPDGSYGPRVREWLGGMISKAASSTWKVGLETASKILTEALNGYYGR